MQIRQPAFPAPNSSLQMMCHYNELYLNKFNTSLIKEENVLKGHTPNQAAGLSFQTISSRGRRELFHGQVILLQALFTFLFTY